MPFCPDCGTEVDAEDVHCYNCGRNLEGGADTDPTDSQQDGGDWGSTWDDEPQGGQQPTGGQSEIDPQTEAKGRHIEDGKVEYTVYFPMTEGYKPIGLGGVALFLSFLILPLFTLFGYIYRITEAAARGETVQPAIDDYAELTKEGFFYFLLYLLVGIVAAIAVGGPVAAGVALESPAVIAFFAVVVSIVVAYVAPAILVLYPVTGSYKEALSPDRIKAFAFTSEYLVAYLILIALSIAFNLVLQVVTLILAITVVGIFLLIPLIAVANAYYFYAIGAYWGATYYEAAEKGIVPHVSEQDEEEPYYQPSEGTDPY